MTTSLTTFLLDRIAEDERRTIGYVNEDRSLSWHALGCGLNDDPGTWCECDVPARVLAECTAKRSVVEYATGHHTSSPEGMDIVRVLAAVYADHPDYDQAWAVL